MNPIRNCPVCASTRSRPLLRLDAAPIYLHPVAADAEVPPPHSVDLDYRQCLDCGHGYQTRFDLDTLARIYRSHYYTPAAEGVGVGARNDFMAFLGANSARSAFTPGRALEVGCSSGEVLNEIRSLFGLELQHLVGVEPNHDTASAAKKLGLDIRETFLDAALAASLGRFDLVVSRHVIEHVEDPRAFFQSLSQVVDDEGAIVLETPSLDACLQRRVDSGFYVEHLHLFSMRSLAATAQGAGFAMVEGFETPLGHMIGVFRRQGIPLALAPTDTHTDLQSSHDQRCRWWKARFEKRPVILWGAGSASRILIAETSCRPLAICDGNPGKAGKKFVGLPHTIRYAPEYIAELIERGLDKTHLLVAASMFFTEIEREAERLGWRGDFLSLYAYAEGGS